ICINVMENKVHIGRNVKRIREILGVKLEMLAMALNRSRQFVHQLEAREELSSGLLGRIAWVLNVPVEAITNFKEEVVNNIFATPYNQANVIAPANQPPRHFNAFENWLVAMDEIKHLYAALLNSERE